MARYDFRCRACGDFEVNQSVHAAVGAVTCPSCGAPARRVFSAPALVAGDSPLRRAQEAARRSAAEPAVVNAVPPSGRRVTRVPNPLHAGLPAP